MEHQQPGHHHSGHKHAALIQQLVDCATACENCAASSLDETDVTTMTHCIEVSRDCADICTLAAKLLIRDSEFANDFLKLCEKACSHCATVCGQHDHQHCKICAEMCEACAMACHNHGENKN